MSDEVWTCMRHKKDYPTRCPWCWIEQLTQEIERLDDERNLWLQAHDAAVEDCKQWRRDAQNFQSRLAQYEGAVEVEGVVVKAVHEYLAPDTLAATIHVPKNKFVLKQRVRVLVLRGEGGE